MTDTDDSAKAPPEEQEVSPMTVLKIVLALVWWFSGIGVGTGFLSPSIVGTAISPEVFMLIILVHFTSVLLILALVPGQDDTTLDSGRVTTR
jgi:uncharacterized membrane protein YphA (DoxX/SURF4 family)